MPQFVYGLFETSLAVSFAVAAELGFLYLDTPSGTSSRMLLINRIAYLVYFPLFFFLPKVVKQYSHIQDDFHFELNINVKYNTNQNPGKEALSIHYHYH